MQATQSPYPLPVAVVCGVGAWQNEGGVDPYMGSGRAATEEASAHIGRGGGEGGGEVAKLGVDSLWEGWVGRGEIEGASAPIGRPAWRNWEA